MKKCAHLVNGKKAACKALNKVYVPSLFQLVEYCRSREYRKCPFYLRGIVESKRRNKSLSPASSFLADMTSR